jgi:hypothetical protein
MRKILLISACIILITAGYSIAQMGGGMMGGNQQQSHHYQYQQQYPYQGGPGMMGGYGMGPGMMGGYGMGPGMMGGYGMGPGMMGGYGMGPGMMGGYGMGPGMMGGYGMGPGMMGGYGMGPGMMGGYQRPYPYRNQQQGGASYGYDAEKYQKFLDDTTKLRKELHDKQFDYFEAMRNPESNHEKIAKLEKEIQDLQKKINEKAPR